MNSNVELSKSRDKNPFIEDGKIRVTGITSMLFTVPANWI